MTVCNMSIEAGARAGLIAPDDTTFAYLEGRAPRAAGRRLGAAPSTTGARCAPTTAPPSTREVALDAADIRPHVSWGTNPGQVVADRRRACPTPTSFADPTRREPPPSGRSSTWASTAGTPMRDIAVDTVFIGSCTNSRIEDLRAAAAVVRRPARSRVGMRALVVPGLPRGEGAGRGRGPRRASSPPPASSGASPGCSMCLAMNPDKLAPGERCASTSEPQLRGPPGPRRAHPPRLARRRRRHRRRRPLRRPDRPGLTGDRDESRAHRHRHRRAARPLRRRHRPDHPARLAEAGRAHRLRRRACSPSGATTATSSSTTSAYAGATHPGRRPELRHRLVARARRLGDHGLRLRRRDLAPLRRHLPQQLHQERPRAGRRRADDVERPHAAAPSRPTRRSRSPSTSNAARSRRRPRPRASSSRSTPPRSTASSKGLDDIGLTLRHDDEIDVLRVVTARMAADHVCRDQLIAREQIRLRLASAPRLPLARGHAESV